MIECFRLTTNVLFSQRCGWILSLLMVAGADSNFAVGQTKSEPAFVLATNDPPLIDQPPFDVIVLNEAAGGKAVKVAPIPFPDRTLKPQPVAGKRLDVILLSYEDRRYEVAWSDIAKVELYELMIYDEAVRKLKEKDFVTAFQNLSFLMKNYPNIVGLERLREDFLFNSAMAMYASGRFTQTLATLEELHKSAPNYQSDSVLNGLNRVTDAIIKQYVDKSDFVSARTMLERLRRDFNDSLASVRTWKSKLQAMANQKKQDAQRLIEAGNYRDARRTAIALLKIFPDEAGAKEVFNEINRRHAMVRVGVMQRSVEVDPASLTNWAARRSGTLVQRPFVEFLETGAEGGRYGFSLGLLRQSEDRLELQLELEPMLAGTLDAFTISQLVFYRSDPSHAQYDPSWSAIMQSVTASSPTTIQVRFKRPNVLPQALMQWRNFLTDSNANPFAGLYRHLELVERESVFRTRQTSVEQGAPVEIIEQFYDDPKAAMNDLLKGDIDVIDQLFPADAVRLASNPNIRIGNYALPTVHMLVPVSDYAYLADDRFRRALLYSTDRQSILTEELLGGSVSPDGKIISGPFPIGAEQSDPLGYAYDSSVKPVIYDSRMAKLLLVLIDQEMAANAEKNATEVPKKRKLVVAVPDFELAKVAVQALIQQWAIVGIEAEMLVLPQGKVSDRDLRYDLLYVTASMWEPLTDIERLLGEQGTARTDNSYIVQALVRLRSARNWREVRTYLQDMHRLVAYHLPVLPLWQVTDRFAVSSSLEGLSGNPVTLYQDVASWRLKQSDTGKVAQQ